MHWGRCCLGGGSAGCLRVGMVGMENSGSPGHPILLSFTWNPGFLPDEMGVNETQKGWG